MLDKLSIKVRYVHENNATGTHYTKQHITETGNQEGEERF